LVEWVLIVAEDESAVCQLFESAGSAGWQVDVARTCLEGMQKYIRRRFSLVLVDLALPVQGGVMLAQFIRNCGDDTALIGIGDRNHSAATFYDTVLSGRLCLRLLSTPMAPA